MYNYIVILNCDGILNMSVKLLKGSYMYFPTICHSWVGRDFCQASQYLQLKSQLWRTWLI